jgi:hypothetical protein
MKNVHSHRRAFFFVQVMLIACLACNRDSCPFSAGKNSSQTRNLPAFSSIVLNDKINLILTQDTVQSITVSGDNNLLPGIHTDVTDGTLTIENRNGCNFLRDPGYVINVYVATSRLQYITYYGAGNITSTNTLNAGEFTVDSWTGTGSVNLMVNCGLFRANVRNANATITVSGQATAVSVYCAEAGSVNLINLSAVDVYVDQKSVRDSYVNVSGQLRADIVYLGNLYYQGNPTKIDTLITSSGRLIHLP